MEVIIQFFMQVINAKVPGILIVVGAMFVVFGVVGRFRDWAEIPAARQLLVIAGGVVSCLVGVVLFVVSTFFGLHPTSDPESSVFPPLGSEEIAIDSVAKLKNYIIEKPLVRADGSTIKLKADHTYEGNINGDEPIGLWAWTNAGFCRAIKIGEFPYPQICGNYTVSKSGVTFHFQTREKEFWRFDN